MFFSGPSSGSISVPVEPTWFPLTASVNPTEPSPLPMRLKLLAVELKHYPLLVKQVCDLAERV